MSGVGTTPLRLPVAIQCFGLILKVWGGGPVVPLSGSGFSIETLSTAPLTATLLMDSVSSLGPLRFLMCP